MDPECTEATVMTTGGQRGVNSELIRKDYK